jgi:hypothetical protein
MILFVAMVVVVVVVVVVAVMSEKLVKKSISIFRKTPTSSSEKLLEIHREAYIRKLVHPQILPFYELSSRSHLGLINCFESFLNFLLEPIVFVKIV